MTSNQEAMRVTGPAHTERRGPCRVGKYLACSVYTAASDVGDMAPILQQRSLGLINLLWMLSKVTWAARDKSRS